MSHKRSEIKAWIKSRLLNQTLAGDQVFCNHSESVAKLPAIIIQTPKEENAKFSETPRILERLCLLVIEGICSGSNLDENLDFISFEIEKLIARDLTFSGLVSDVVLKLSEQEQSSDGAEPIGSVKLVYKVKYHTKETPEVEAKELSGITTEFRLKRRQGTWQIGRAHV